MASTWAWAVAAKVLCRSCTPAAQIWPAFIIASKLPWLKDTNSSADFTALSMVLFTSVWVFSKPANAPATLSFRAATVWLTVTTSSLPAVASAGAGLVVAVGFLAMA